MQHYTVYLYLETALHVSGGTTTHNRERKQLYPLHLVFVTSLLLPAAIAAYRYSPNVAFYIFFSTNISTEYFNPWVTNVIYIYIYIYIYMEHPFLMFLDHTQRRSTVGRTPLDE